MAVKFQTKIRKARFHVEGYTPEQMASVATVLRDSIEQRILRAMDVNDAAAPPLKQPIRNVTSRRNVVTVNGQRLIQLPGKEYRGYPYYKQKRGGNPVRDWKLSGRTLRSMRVLTAAANRAVIGFTDAEANKRAYINNRRWRQFGMSPRDRAAMMAAFAGLRPVKTKAA